MTKYILAFALSALAFAASAQSLPFDAPVTVPPQVELVPQTHGAWTEVYLLDGTTAPAALQKLVETRIPPAPLAVLAGGQAFLSKKGVPLALEVTEEVVTRNRAPVSYADDCSVVPTVGDSLTVHAGTGSTQVTFEGKLLEHFVFGRPTELHATPVRLSLDVPGHCDAVEESRMVFDGQVSMTVEGRDFKVPALIQVITQP